MSEFFPLGNTHWVRTLLEILCCEKGCTLDSCNLIMTDHWIRKCITLERSGAKKQILMLLWVDIFCACPYWINVTEQRGEKLADLCMVLGCLFIITLVSNIKLVPLLVDDEKKYGEDSSFQKRYPNTFIRFSKNPTLVLIFALLLWKVRLITFKTRPSDACKWRNSFIHYSPSASSLRTLLWPR